MFGSSCCFQICQLYDPGEMWCALCFGGWSRLCTGGAGGEQLTGSSAGTMDAHSPGVKKVVSKGWRKSPEEKIHFIQCVWKKYVWAFQWLCWYLKDLSHLDVISCKPLGVPKKLKTWVTKDLVAANASVQDPVARDYAEGMFPGWNGRPFDSTILNWVL